GAPARRRQERAGRERLLRLLGVRRRGRRRHPLLVRRTFSETVGNGVPQPRVVLRPVRRTEPRRGGQEGRVALGRHQRPEPPREHPPHPPARHTGPPQGSRPRGPLGQAPQTLTPGQREALTAGTTATATTAAVSANAIGYPAPETTIPKTIAPS